MAPDIEAYAPFIRAVFDMDRDDGRRMPYSISDGSFRRSSQLADALMALLDIQGRRFEASYVMDLLDREPVKARFGLDEGALRKIHAGVAGSGIRWGRDGREKEAMGLPGFEENTWEFGLKRLLLGYAMAGDALFAGIAPMTEMDPASAALLGSFMEFVERLFAAVEDLRRERGLGEWSEKLLEVIDGLFAVDDDGVQELLRLKSAVRGLEKTGRDASFTGTLGIDVVRQHLARAFGSAAEGAGFLDRGVTFCSMLPMRSIPFKVICLLGMNHEAFPRRDYLSGLDLVAMKPKKGDRSRREDDLYLFLEALLSARDVLVISYIGQGIQDNALIPPSVVVSSLLEYLDRAFKAADGKVSKAVVVKHCLQAFNPRYFLEGTGLFSYSKDNALAARALRAGPAARPERKALGGVPDEPWRSVDLERLLEFFRGPARFFLKHRLGVMLPREEEAVLDREPFTLTGLERYSLQQRVLRERLAGEGVETDLARLRAEGVLPHGVPGELTLSGMAHEIDAFLPLITQAMAGRQFEKTSVAVAVDGFTVSGVVDSIGGTGFLSFRYARTTPLDLLRAWLSTLLLQAVHPGVEMAGMHIHKEGLVRFAPVNEPLAVLKGLLGVYRQGLSGPVHFFPRSSLAYAQSWKKYASQERAMQDARKQWEGTWDLGGESGDASSHLCFAGADPLDGGFRDLATAVFGPLLESMEAK
jgi:exodeoxyribonuclease V gamma subunit